MARSAKAPRRATIRATRETFALAVAACAATFALAYAVHTKPAAEVVTQVSPSRNAAAKASAGQGSPAREWTGHLADVAPQTAVAPAEPMTSASLVVSPSQLPQVTIPARPTGRRACEGPSCPTKPVTAASSPMPPSRPAGREAVPVPPMAGSPQQERGWAANINPLNHLPDAATLKQPFTYVGDKVAGWFK